MIQEERLDQGFCKQSELIQPNSRRRDLVDVIKETFGAFQKTTDY
jgi:hypothetical protein